MADWHWRGEDGARPAGFCCVQVRPCLPAWKSSIWLEPACHCLSALHPCQPKLAHHPTRRQGGPTPFRPRPCVPANQKWPCFRKKKLLLISCLRSPLARFRSLSSALSQLFVLAGHCPQSLAAMSRLVQVPPIRGSLLFSITAIGFEVHDLTMGVAFWRSAMMASSCFPSSHFAGCQFPVPELPLLSGQLIPRPILQPTAACHPHLSYPRNLSRHLACPATLVKSIIGHGTDLSILKRTVIFQDMVTLPHRVVANTHTLISIVPSSH